MREETLFEVESHQLLEGRYYDPATHLWIGLESATRARCGFDPLGAETCGDIVAVSFEPVGSKIPAGEAFGTLEAAKFVGPLISPVAGTIASHNHAVVAHPGLINDAPLRNWLVELDSIGLEAEVEERLLHRRREIADWYRLEIERFKSQGMIAE